MAKSGRKGYETAVLVPLDWVEERSGLVGYTKWFLFRKVPHDISWAQTLGAASLTAFIVQLITGVFLAMYYRPDPATAYASIQNITTEVTLGCCACSQSRKASAISRRTTGSKPSNASTASSTISPTSPRTT